MGKLRLNPFFNKQFNYRQLIWMLHSGGNNGKSKHSQVPHLWETDILWKSFQKVLVQSLCTTETSKLSRLKYSRLQMVDLNKMLTGITRSFHQKNRKEFFFFSWLQFIMHEALHQRCHFMKKINRKHQVTLDLPTKCFILLGVVVW